MGNTKTIEVDDEKKLLCFYDKRIGAEVPCDSLGPEWAGYVAKITGGNDKQGFPMMQGVLVNHRVRLLFKKGMPCFRERRKGSMKRKSVRGCVVASDLSALNLAVTKIGDETIEGFTDVARPNRLGPKRATKIRKMFNLSKEDDVRKYVVRRVIKEGKTKAPRITRLITKERLDRKAARRREKINRKERTKAMSKEYREVIKAYVAKRTAVKTKALERKEAAKKRALAKKGITYTKPERIAARKAKIAAAKEEQAAVKAGIKERAKAAALAKAAAAGKA